MPYSPFLSGRDDPTTSSDAADAAVDGGLVKTHEERIVAVLKAAPQGLTGHEIAMRIQERFKAQMTNTQVMRRITQLVADDKVHRRPDPAKPYRRLADGTRVTVYVRHNGELLTFAGPPASRQAKSEGHLPEIRELLEAAAEQVAAGEKSYEELCRYAWRLFVAAGLDERFTPTSARIEAYDVLAAVKRREGQSGEVRGSSGREGKEDGCPATRTPTLDPRPCDAARRRKSAAIAKQIAAVAHVPAEQGTGGREERGA